MGRPYSWLFGLLVFLLLGSFLKARLLWHLEVLLARQRAWNELWEFVDFAVAHGWRPSPDVAIFLPKVKAFLQRQRHSLGVVYCWLARFLAWLRAARKARGKVLKVYGSPPQPLHFQYLYKLRLYYEMKRRLRQDAIRQGLQALGGTRRGDFSRRRLREKLERLRGRC